MNIELLKYFKDIADAKSISKVAANSHISQSALSQMIQKLEDNIGYEIFLRSNKGVELTESGKILYDYTVKIIKIYHKMIDEMSSISKGQYKITINSTWAITDYSLPAVLIEMKKRYPLINYEIHSFRSEDIIKHVENGLADFGIICGDFDSKILDFYHLINDKILFVAGRHFNVPEKITADELLKYKIIYFKTGCYNDDITKALAKHATTKPYNLNPLLNLDSITAVKSSTMEGYGISFLPKSTIKKELEYGSLKIVHIEGVDFDLRVDIICLNDFKLKYYIKKIIEDFVKIGTKLA